MKRLLSIITALLVAALFILPAAAIAHLDGTEPEWDGDPGIRPLSETIDGFEPIVPISDELPDGEAVLYVGEPTDEPPGNLDTEDDSLGIDRSQLARGADTEIEPVVMEGAQSAALSGVNLALYIGLGAVSLVALALSVIAIVKASRKK